MSQRFSKAALKAHIEHRLTHLQEAFNFDPHNGYSQVIGLPEGANRAYGTFTTLLDLADAMNLGPLQYPYVPGLGDLTKHRVRKMDPITLASF